MEVAEKYKGQYEDPRDQPQIPFDSHSYFLLYLLLKGAIVVPTSIRRFSETCADSQLQNFATVELNMRGFAQIADRPTAAFDDYEEHGNRELSLK